VREIETGSGGSFDTGFADGVARWDEDSGANAEEAREVIAAGGNLFGKLIGGLPDALGLPHAFNLAIFVCVAVNHNVALALVDEAANIVNEWLVITQRVITGSGSPRKENYFFMLWNGLLTQANDTGTRLKMGRRAPRVQRVL